ncbi:hypothetical protein OWO78_01210 [Bacillus pacificus]|uniref:DNA-binding protein n=1 Tax=Bacillus pacificus TaxID=2026187 RepID=A0AAW6YRA6_9BACI|nr:MULTISPECIES: hypothetical protein [Bacillus cereus group]ONG81216.1 hypothetical protein BKK41_11990 [Bacillus cereus]MDK7385478.1 hypothetical protein [Bacillus pacificus]MDK7390053.1 hypothetical protein [Bacillus pacificus]MDK7397079.1 hypothetical protein [Bacillus pacificus]MDK7401623.1 hypothetical protein [Bacillus pacificus]
MNQGYIDVNQLDYKITNRGLKFLIDNNIIRAKREGKKIFLCKNDLLKHEAWEMKFSREYFTVKQLWKHLGIKNLENKRLSYVYYKNLNLLAEEGIIHIKTLKYPLLTLDNKEYQHAIQYIKKSEIIKILDEYVSTNEFLRMASIGYSHAIGIVNKFNIRKIQFIKKKENTFYKKEDIKAFLKYREKTVGEKIRLNAADENLIIKQDTCKILNLNSYNYKKFLEEDLLKIHEKAGRNIFFVKEEVLALKKRIEKIDESLKSKYYTRNEIFKEYGINVDAIKEDIKTIEVPLLVRGISRYLFNKCLYLKKDIIKEYERRNERLNIYLDRGSIYDNVLYRLEAEGIEFSDRCKETELLWFEFIRFKSNLYAGRNNASKDSRVLEYFVATKILAERLVEKEIFMCSTKELNLMFFNQNTGMRIKKPIYIFLKELGKTDGYPSCKKSFKLNEINSPYKAESKKKNQVNVYTPEEYKEFFNYISDLVIHKDRAIQSVKEDIDKFVNGGYKNKYFNRYDSVWLYMLVHLNNAWRHWDCTEIPRINFEGTNIDGSIEWLQNNNISMEDAKKVVRKLQIKNLKHSKTGAERYFYCSEQLTLPVAYAAVLCEIRTRLLNPLSESLIDFRTKNRALTSYPYKKFFCDFSEPDLKFSSLKMNRTFITFAFNIINKYKNSAHEIEVLKFLRNHKSLETTNMYIYISQRDIDFLSNQIFSRDYFGFIADGFADILFGATQDITERTMQISVIYEKIGKDLRLEGIADTLMYLSKQESIVKDIIHGLDEQVTHNMYNMLNSGILYSKTRDVQCLLSAEDCMYPNRETCIGCPFAIYNFYALSAITERILKHIVRLVENKEISRYKGDNERDAILFIKDLKLFKEAEAKFGPCIYEFFNMSQEKFESMLLHLPPVTQYIQKKREV